MNEVWNAIAEICLELHPERVEAISSGILAVNGVREIGRTRDRFGPNAGRFLFSKLREAWEKADAISPIEIVAGLKAASATAALQGSKGALELVWSGPVTEQVPVRQTEEVICQVIEASQTRISIISFAVYRIERVIQCLEAAASRGVKVDALFESSEIDGGKVKTDGFTLLRKRIPTATLWRWDQNQAEPSDFGAVHAKCILADNHVAFVSSANLTGAAMHKNIEVGVLITGGKVPSDLRETLIELQNRAVLSMI